MSMPSVHATSTLNEHTDVPLTAAARLQRAQLAHDLAVSREQAVRLRIHDHGGIGRCSDGLIDRLMRAHERAFLTGLDVERWTQRAAREAR